MQSPGTILNAIASFEKSNQSLRKRWDDDFDLYRLLEYKAGKGYYSYTSNAPRVLVDKIIAMFCQANLLIQIPPENLSPDDRKIASCVEKFLYGCLYVNDDRLIKLDYPKLKNAIAWFLAARGGLGIRTYVKKDENGKTIPEIIPWDLYSTAYDIGPEGGLKTFKRKVTKRNAIGEYPDKLKGQITSNNDEIDIVDCWDNKEHGTFIDPGQIWVIDPEKHGLDHNPVHIIRAGAMPPIRSDKYQEINHYRGESALAANRQLYPLMNKTMSDLLTLVRRGVKVPLQYKSADGKKTLAGDIYQVEKGSVIPMEVGESLEPVIKESMPTDAQALIAIMTGEMQRGGLPHTSYGELGFRLSGYALSQLQDAIITVIAMFLEAGETIYTVVTDELMSQFASGGYNPIEVMGKTSTGETFGYPTRLKIKSSDLKEDWRPTIKLEAKLPKDEAQSFYLANLARTGEIPLLSNQTILEEILKVQDADLELTKIDEEWGRNIPLVRLQKTFNAYIERNEPDKARLVLQEMVKLIQSMQAKLPRAQQAPQNVPGGPVAEGGTGMPPEVLPQEQLGGFPGGAVNAGGV